jgi:hypothetical protein
VSCDDIEKRARPYSVHLVDKRGMRRQICRCATIQDCAEVADQLLRGAPGMMVECLLETHDGAQPVSVTADPIGRQTGNVDN